MQEAYSDCCDAIANAVCCRSERLGFRHFMRCICPAGQIALDRICDQAHLIPAFNNLGRKAGRGTLSTQCACNHETALLVVQDILKHGAASCDRVVVVGCDQIEVLIELAHHGFDEVTCRAAQAGPAIGNETADIVIAPEFDREPNCIATLERIERALQPNGLLFLGTSRSSLNPRIQQIRKFLEQTWFVFTRTNFYAVDLTLYCCRKTAAAEARAA